MSKFVESPHTNPSMANTDLHYLTLRFLFECCTMPTRRRTKIKLNTKDLKDLKQKCNISAVFFCHFNLELDSFYCVPLNSPKRWSKTVLAFKRLTTKQEKQKTTTRIMWENKCHVVNKIQEKKIKTETAIKKNVEVNWIAKGLNTKVDDSIVECRLCCWFLFLD